MITFNSKTITLKVSSKGNNFRAYDKKNTKLRADALTAVFVSANPLRKDYDFNGANYDYIASKREEIERLMSELERYLDDTLKKAK